MTNKSDAEKLRLAAADLELDVGAKWGGATPMDKFALTLQEEIHCISCSFTASGCATVEPFCLHAGVHVC